MLNFKRSTQPTMVRTNFSQSFLSKVMTFFGLALLVSAGGTYVTMTYFMNVIMGSRFLIYGLFAIELILVFTSRMWSTKEPMNKVLFFVFAFISGATLAPLIVLASAALGPIIIVKALLVTGLMFGAAAIIGATTTVNLAGMGGFLMIGLVGMIITSVVGIFVPWSNTFEMVFSGIGVILFSAFAVYDIQKIKYYPENQYINAALNLYLDVFNLFIYVLRLLMSLSRD